MQITDVLLLVVEREGKDGLHGRTLLQKKLYFLSVLRKANFGFSAHYYGPYSGFVAEHLNGLVEDGIFKEVTEFFTTDSTERNALGEKRRHTYFLTDAGRRVWQTTQKKMISLSGTEHLRKSTIKKLPMISTSSRLQRKCITSLIGKEKRV